MSLAAPQNFENVRFEELWTTVYARQWVGGIWGAVFAAFGLVAWWLYRNVDRYQASPATGA